MIGPWRRRQAALLVVGLLAWNTALGAPMLPALAAQADAVTVSGLSSGAYMAVQFQVAYSQRVKGAGILAGGPYYCAQGQVKRALANCMAPTAIAAPPDVAQQQEVINRLAKDNRIDPPQHLRDDRVWLFYGEGDRTVAPAVMEALAGFYQVTLPKDAIKLVRHPVAGHAMPSVVAPQANACATSDAPYINRCADFDAAGELLNHLLGSLKPRRASPDGQLSSFDQRRWVSGGALDASMADDGYVYVPKECQRGGCRIHVAFHGCRQGTDAIGTQFAAGAGYNEWADTNRLIVLYPQVRARTGLALGSWITLMNPKGCWDWWGYTGEGYHTRDGVQMRAVIGMIEQLSRQRAP